MSKKSKENRKEDHGRDNNMREQHKQQIIKDIHQEEKFNKAHHHDEDSYKQQLHTEKPRIKKK